MTSLRISPIIYCHVFVAGEVMQVSGWGQTASGQTSTVLKEGTMHTMTDEKCSKGWDQYVSEKTLCVSPGTGL